MNLVYSAAVVDKHAGMSSNNAANDASTSGLERRVKRIDGSPDESLQKPTARFPVLSYIRGCGKEPTIFESLRS